MFFVTKWHFKKMLIKKTNIVCVSGPRGLPGPRSFNNEQMKSKHFMKFYILIFLFKKLMLKSLKKSIT